VYENPTSIQRESNVKRGAPLLLATTNQGKIREIVQLLADLRLDCRSLTEWPEIAAPDETGATFRENARQKALYYAARTGLVAVAEDSGLAVDALGGDPGVHSARFGGADSSYAEKFALIEARLARIPEADRSARFVCALAVADAGRIVFEADGVVEGFITSEPRGSGGFGYDPIFFYPPFGCTLAEAGDRKSEVSHRAAAFRQLRAWLQSLDP
jgi:XTP/dITP diphosphohydrolase